MEDRRKKSKDNPANTAKQVEKELLARTTLVHKGELSRGLTRIGELRGADAVQPRRK